MDERSASIALAQFVQKYGQEALEELVTDVREGEYDNIGGKADGMIDGGGDGNEWTQFLPLSMVNKIFL